MIDLHGAAASPYYNMIKLALLEKGVRFQEIFTRPSQDEGVILNSPMGKIPYIKVGDFVLSESNAILEWLEDAYPTASLLPPTPNQRARAREIKDMIVFYLLEPCLPLIRHFIRGTVLTQVQIEQSEKQMKRGIQAIATRVEMQPWLAGTQFSVADVAGAAIFPVVTFMTRKILDTDIIECLPQAESYYHQLANRPSVAKVWKDRDAVLQSIQAARSSTA